MRVEKQKQEGTFVPQRYETLDTMRVEDKTIKAHDNDVQAQEELLHAETNDELRAYFTQDCDPHIFLTTSYGASKRTVDLCRNIESIFGGTVEYHPREEEYPVREKAIELAGQGYTSMMII